MIVHHDPLSWLFNPVKLKIHKKISGESPDTDDCSSVYSLPGHRTFLCEPLSVPLVDCYHSSRSVYTLALSFYFTTDLLLNHFSVTVLDMTIDYLFVARSLFCDSFITIDNSLK